MDEARVAFSDTPTAAPRGHFHLEVRRNGELVEVVDEPNLIVGGASAVHARLLGGDFATFGRVTTISFGTGSAPPATGNTSITGAFDKPLDGVSYPAPGQVAFAFSLASGEDNGAAISEFGLKTTSGALYARKTRANALNKAADLSLSGTWTITFPAST